MSKPRLKVMWDRSVHGIPAMTVFLERADEPDVLVAYIPGRLLAEAEAHLGLLGWEPKEWHEVPVLPDAQQSYLRRARK